MLSLSDGRRFYLYRQSTAMRKSFDGLSGLVRQELGKDPLSGEIFIFLNKRRTQIKLLLWEQDGFSIYHKRLERATYELPLINTDSFSMQLKAQDLLLILKGIFLRHVKRRVRYENSLYR